MLANLAVRLVGALLFNLKGVLSVMCIEGVTSHTVSLIDEIYAVKM